MNCFRASYTELHGTKITFLWRSTCLLFQLSLRPSCVPVLSRCEDRCHGHHSHPALPSPCEETKRCLSSEAPCFMGRWVRGEHNLQQQGHTEPLGGGVCVWKTKQLVQGFFNGPGLFILNIFYRGRESRQTTGGRGMRRKTASLSFNHILRTHFHVYM